MSKFSRAGSKFCRSHTTCIPFAARVVDAIYPLESVTQIILGYIKPGLGHGQQRVKIAEDGACIVLSVRGGTSHQEVRVLVTSLKETKLAIARALRTAKISICFRESEAGKGR